MIHLMLKHITYKNSLKKVIRESFHPNAKCINFWLKTQIRHPVLNPPRSALT